MSKENPSPRRLHRREAGVAEMRRVRLSPNPKPYHVRPRDEAGPEALPPAPINGSFRPIRRRGPETPAPLVTGRDKAGVTGR